MSNQTLTIRPYNEADQNYVDALTWPSLSDRRQLFRSPSTTILFTTSSLSLTVVDASNRIVGCATFDDKLPVTLSTYPDAHSYLQRKLSLGKPQGCLVLSYFCQDPEISHSWLVTELFNYVFQTRSAVGGIVLPVPTGVDLQEIHLFDHTFSCYDPVSVHTGALFRFYRIIRMDIDPLIRIRSILASDTKQIVSITETQGIDTTLVNQCIQKAIQEPQHYKCMVVQALQSQRVQGVLSCTNIIPSQYGTLFSTLYQQRTVRQLKTSEKPLQMILIGPTGSGKTVQCGLLVEEFGIVHVSLQELIQRHIKNQTAIGIKIQSFQQKSIPDELILDIILERLGDVDCAQNGWILDGFPQTEIQARMLINHRVVPDIVVVLDITEQAVLQRLCPRRMDSETGYVYHLEFSPPPQEIPVERLKQAPEDHENAVQERYKSHYHHIDVQPFMKLTKMSHIDAARTRDSIMKKILRDVYDAKKWRRPLQVRHAPRLVITGPPGSGKRTQCESIVNAFHVVHLSTGDMLRSAIQDYGSELGRQAKKYVESGVLVPDSLMIDLILTRLEQRDCIKNGWLLDGFPRTQEQATAMIAKGIIPDAIFVLQVPDSIVIERISGRVMDPETGTSYHTTFKPPPSEIAHRCIQRNDDTVETIRVRLQAYHDHCNQVQKVFSTHACQIVTVDGTISISKITNQLCTPIEQILVQQNCFMIDLYSLNPEYLRRIQHLLIYAFQMFPDKDCIVYGTNKGKTPLSIVNGFQAIESKSTVFYVLHRHELPFLSDQPLAEAIETIVEKTQQMVIVKSGCLGRMKTWKREWFG